MRKTLALSGVLAVALASSPPAAHAAEDWEDWATGDRWRFGVGYFLPNLDTTVRVTDENGAVGTAISFENNLGLDDQDGTVIVEAGWRFFKKHSLAYNFFDLKRSGTTTSSVTIAVGEEVFDVTLPIQSFFDITGHEIAYSYSLVFDEKKDFFVGAGISLQDVALGIRGTASSPNPGEIIDSRLASTAPLPTLNVGFDYAFSDNWLFQSRLGWLAVELDLGADEDLSGQIISANVGVLWKAFRNVGFFGQYQLFDVNVDYIDAGAKFELDYNYHGPMVGVYASF